MKVVRFLVTFTDPWFDATTGFPVRVAWFALINQNACYDLYCLWLPVKYPLTEIICNLLRKQITRYKAISFKEIENMEEIDPFYSELLTTKPKSI